jgi:hypothetical protein
VFFSKTFVCLECFRLNSCTLVFWLATFCFLGDVPKFRLNIILAGKLIVLIPIWMKRTVAVFPADRWTLLRLRYYPSHHIQVWYRLDIMTLLFENCCTAALTMLTRFVITSWMDKWSKLFTPVLPITPLFTLNLGEVNSDINSFVRRVTRNDYAFPFWTQLTYN